MDKSLNTSWNNQAEANAYIGNHLTTNSQPASEEESTNISAPSTYIREQADEYKENITTIPVPQSVPVELKPYFLFNSSFSGKIKPQSVNSMYFFDNKTATLKKASSAEQYEKQIKHLVEQKMTAKLIPQIRKPVILDIVFEIELGENLDGSISGRGRIDLDNLMKASIDSLSRTIINDDILVYGLHARINYKKKTVDSFLKPANSIRFHIYDYNEQTSNYYKGIIEQQRFKASTHTTLDLENWLTIPSYNSMYVIKDGRRVLWPIAAAYKEKLKADFVERFSFIEPDKEYYAIYGNFGAYNYESRDLDNMLKATFDTFTNIVYKDDKQILEFYVEKHKAYTAGEVYLKFYQIENPLDYIWETDEDR